MHPVAALAVVGAVLLIAHVMVQRIMGKPVSLKMPYFASSIALEEEYGLGGDVSPLGAAFAAKWLPPLTGSESNATGFSPETQAWAETGY